MFKTEATAMGTANKAGEKTKAVILQTALHLFRGSGFEVTTMRDIARAAKVATGAAYYYFPSKEAMVAAYYDQVQRLHRERARDELMTKAGLRERLGVVMHSKLEILKDDRMFSHWRQRCWGCCGRPVGPRKSKSFKELEAVEEER